jgi:hypothetical protein
MSDRLHDFVAPGGRRTAVSLPFALDELIGAWSALRRTMARTVAEPFARDEWAYLITFLDPHSLRAPFARTFGAPASEDGAGGEPVGTLARPRGAAAVWLPNNVTLLGPLTVVLISLTGAPVTLKVGSRADDLTSPWVLWLREHAPEGPLRDWARDRVTLLTADRDDPRTAELAAAAAVRIAFGSDAGVAGVERLEHPAGSYGFAFADRRSEAWIEPGRDDEATLRALVRVFAIFGQAGCTSPRRVVLVGGSDDDARALADRLLALWPEVEAQRPAMHVASANLAARQRALAAGWDARLAHESRAMVASGAADLPIVESIQSLFVCAADPAQALATAPPNLQTIGHAVAEPGAPRWLDLVARSGAKRFVPLATMHHFGPVWDGHAFWRALFEEIEVVA